MARSVDEPAREAKVLGAKSGGRLKRDRAFGGSAASTLESAERAGRTSDSSPIAAASRAPRTSASSSAGLEHERRKIVVPSQPISDARLALDRCARGHEIPDIPVHRPLGDLQLLREPASGHRAPSPAEPLDDLEESVGAAHGPTILRLSPHASFSSTSPMAFPSGSANIPMTGPPGRSVRPMRTRPPSSCARSRELVTDSVET